MFNKFKYILACLGLMAGLMQPAQAEPAEWRLASLEGVVRVMQPGSAIIKGKQDMTLPIGTVVTTGRESSVTLTNGRQQIDIAADARLTVVESSDGLTVVRQDAGAAFYQVDRKSMPHFRVDTNLLAAVVKGTGFTVSAGPEADVVHVAHGLVEVSLQQGSGAVDVNPGETARIERMAPSEIKVTGTKEASAVPAAIVVPAINYAEASGNLLQPVAGQGHVGQGRSSSLPDAAGQGQDMQTAVRENLTAANVRANEGGANANAAAGNGAGNSNGASNGNGNPAGDAATNGAGNGNGASNGNGNGAGDAAGNGGGNPADGDSRPRRVPRP